MKILGIDPGAKGALAWLLPDGTGRFERMPAVPKVGLQVATFRDLLEADRPDFVVLERAQAMPGQGVSSMFNYGRMNGQIEGVLVTLRIPFETVPPATWHRDLCGARRQGETGEQAKARALQVVQQRLPRFVLPPGKAVREAVVDAACLTLWGQLHMPAVVGAARRLEVVSGG